MRRLIQNIIIVLLLTVSVSSCWFVNDGMNTVKDEFAPSQMLEKYEWFKDASAQLDKKIKDIEVYTANIEMMELDYENIPRTDWDRVDKEQFNQWRIELAGIKASYNDLAAEYNSQSSKFNWAPFEGNIPKEYRVLLHN